MTTVMTTMMMLHHTTKVAQQASKLLLMPSRNVCRPVILTANPSEFLSSPSSSSSSSSQHHQRLQLRHSSSTPTPTSPPTSAPASTNRWYSTSNVDSQPNYGRNSERLGSEWFGAANDTPVTTCSDGRETADATPLEPGSRAFVQCDREALMDLFQKYAVDCDVSGRYLDRKGLAAILRSVGESCTEQTLEELFQEADVAKNGLISLEEFLISSDKIIGNAPARIVLVVGGPGSGKGLLCKRLERQCGVVHLSSGDLLRDEIRRDTVLGKQVQDVMSRGELVSSAVIVTLVRRVMQKHPGKRVLLDGFPRSLQNAQDMVTLCGVPELALHLECDDTILMERIIARGDQANKGGTKRSDDNFHTALTRLRTYHKYHHQTMEWLREQHVPVVNLDCSGTPEEVWEQLEAIGRLMRPATRIPSNESAQTGINSIISSESNGNSERAA